VKFNPKSRRSELESIGPLEVLLNVREVEPKEPEPGTRRTRRVVGHAYMVDVEPGKQRVRLKLTEGRDLTVDFDENRPADEIAAALDRPIEIEVEEEVSGDVPARRIARSLTLLPLASADVAPPKSLAELMAEQHMPEERPDYTVLASKVWSTEEEFREFEEHLKEIRQWADAS
jgi:hypothetical protein